MIQCRRSKRWPIPPRFVGYWSVQAALRHGSDWPRSEQPSISSFSSAVVPRTIHAPSFQKTCDPAPGARLFGLLVLLDEIPLRSFYKSDLAGFAFDAEGIGLTFFHRHLHFTWALATEIRLWRHRYNMFAWSESSPVTPASQQCRDMFAVHRNRDVNSAPHRVSSVNDKGAASIATLRRGI